MVAIKNQVIDLGRLQMDMQSLNNGSLQTPKANSESQGFLNMLQESVKEVNQDMRLSEKASMDLASGKNGNIHETMLAVTKAELGFSMMVQVRNKAIEAYQDIMRMQV